MIDNVSSLINRKVINYIMMTYLPNTKPETIESLESVVQKMTFNMNLCPDGDHAELAENVLELVDFATETMQQLSTDV